MRNCSYCPGVHRRSSAQTDRKSPLYEVKIERITRYRSYGYRLQLGQPEVSGMQVGIQTMSEHRTVTQPCGRGGWYTLSDLIYSLLIVQRSLQRSLHTVNCNERCTEQYARLFKDDLVTEPDRRSCLGNSHCW
jgi:hypothetical protein